MDHHVVVAIGEVISDVRCVQEIVREVLLDYMLLIARTDDKLVVAVVGVELHNVKQDGHPAQFHHGLWFKLAFFRNSGAKATG